MVQESDIQELEQKLDELHEDVSIEEEPKKPELTEEEIEEDNYMNSHTPEDGNLEVVEDEIVFGE